MHLERIGRSGSCGAILDPGVKEAPGEQVAFRNR